MARVQERIEPRVIQREPIEPSRVEVATAEAWAWAPFLLVTVVALGLRLYDLGVRAMHHDESLHAIYGWYLYVGRGYTHDPMMHGPFLFHLTALMYALFGDNEVTARLPMALLGTAAVFLPYFLRHELGRFGAIAVSVMLALGPAFLYFSRFGHNEGMLVFQTLLIVVGIFGWVRTRRSAYLYVTAVALGLMFSTKVVSLMFGFTIAAFVGLALLVERWRPLEYSVRDAVRDVGWQRLGVCVAIVAGISVTLYTTFFTNLDGLCTALYSPPFGSCAGKQGMLQYWWAQQDVARGSQPWFYYFLLIPLYEIVPVVLALAAPFLARRPRSLFFWFCAFWAVFSILMYSKASEKMPWLIVHPTLPLVMLAGLALDEPLSRLRRPWGLAGRQWAVAGLVVLAVAVLIALATVGGDVGSPLAAQTAVLRRIALGLVLLGVLFGAFRVADGLKRRQLVGAIGTGLMSILVVYAIHTGWQLTYKNGDTPVEMAVYVQSSPDIPFIVSEIERFGNQTGQRKELPILLDGGYTETDASGQQVPHEAVSWPFEWYFRDFKGKQYYTKSLPSDFSSGRFAALLVMGTNLDPIRDQLSGYTGNKFRLNWWYPEDYKQLTLSTIWETLIDPVARGKLIKYILYRELINPPLGARELWFYVRNDLAIGGGTGAPAGAGTAPVAPAGPAPAARAELVVQAVTSYGRPGGQAALRDPKGFTLDRAGRLYVVDAGNNNVVVFNPDGTVARMLGRPGSGDGELKEPWGIAVAADGSIFVADTWNHRIQKFDAEGRFITKWGIFEASTAPNALYGPRDVAINAAGELLITDTGNKRIQVFDQAGKHLRSFGAEGAGPGQFREPVGVAVDRQGRIYVADTWNQRIQVFNATFQPIAQYPVPGWGSQSLVNKPYLAVSAEGDIYATSPERGSVIRIRDGVVTTLVLPASPRLEAPTGIHIEGERLLISDARTASVVAYDLDLQAEQDSTDSE